MQQVPSHAYPLFSVGLYGGWELGPGSLILLPLRYRGMSKRSMIHEANACCLMGYSRNKAKKQNGRPSHSDLVGGLSGSLPH